MRVEGGFCLKIEETDLSGGAEVELLNHCRFVLAICFGSSPYRNPLTPDNDKHRWECEGEVTAHEAHENGSQSAHHN